MEIIHPIIREFFRIKGADDFRSIFETKNDRGLQGRKLKRVTKVYNCSVSKCCYFADVTKGRRQA